MSFSFQIRSPVIAHRGASASAPENTLMSIMLAREERAKWVEFDVKLTSDGVPILMHDDTLERTTNGKGNVADATWDEIKNLDAGSWQNPRFKNERVPHLAEVLRLIMDGGMQPNIEIKPCPGRDRVTAMVTMIESSKLWPDDRPPPLISSFSEEALNTAMQLMPDWPRSFCFGDWQQGWQEAAVRVKAAAVTVDKKLLSADHLHALKKTGLAILAYTINDPAQARDLLNQGVTAVFSDRPQALLEAL